MNGEPSQRIAVFAPVLSSSSIAHSVPALPRSTFETPPFLFLPFLFLQKWSLVARRSPLGKSFLVPNSFHNFVLGGHLAPFRGVGSDARGANLSDVYRRKERKTSKRVDGGADLATYISGNICLLLSGVGILPSRRAISLIF